MFPWQLYVIDQSIRPAGDRSVAQHALVVRVFRSFSGLSAGELPLRVNGGLDFWNVGICMSCRNSPMAGAQLFAENTFPSRTLMCRCKATVSDYDKINKLSNSKSKSSATRKRNAAQEGHKDRLYFSVVQPVV